MEGADPYGDDVDWGICFLMSRIEARCAGCSGCHGAACNKYQPLLRGGAAADRGKRRGLMTRLHPRCGTSFLLVVMVISILIFSIASSLLLTRVPPGPGRPARQPGLYRSADDRP